ncbi:MAG: hypothetical protein A2498_12115 [Lentisphaerae bacterium RIFOXYC12_FULL_60_16]|nr:MAG: hypothetical protein A2498_12115 [Lentisphaerae bacterium RIFOXYC12_FULL_60_16]OGV71162.1 MAG: hypothetical protein A2269_03630 [Lentisphaerae bacterium RIFOXYA12_FULL_60_10]OGV77339.1 MAG: hypothetical protein A2340_06460 [Lentisphaerae bacterium RIFOXYB12_FULL_60_10]
MKHRFIILLLAGLAFQAQAVHAEHPMSVITTIFPLYDWARLVGGQHVVATLLLPPGVEAHGFAPRPTDIVRIHKAQIVIWAGPLMEPWATGLLTGSPQKGTTILDVSQGIESALLTETTQDQTGMGAHGNEHQPHASGHQDPHFWLDPVLAKTIVAQIGKTFSEIDPGNAGTYQTNAAAYIKTLQELDTTIRTTLARCRHSTILYGGHFAFGHFARRYGLRHVSPYRGFAPDAAPTPRAVADMIRQMKQLDMNVIYHEELVDPKVARIIAEETGARLLLLHGAHNLSRTEREQNLTYLDIMRQNLERLKDGLGYTP